MVPGDVGGGPDRIDDLEVADWDGPDDGLCGRLRGMKPAQGTDGAQQRCRKCGSSDAHFTPPVVVAGGPLPKGVRPRVSRHACRPGSVPFRADGLTRIRGFSDGSHAVRVRHPYIRNCYVSGSSDSLTLTS